MSDSIGKKPVHISPTDLAEIAAKGVARAVEARKAVGVELSTTDVAQVSGGAVYLLYRAGGIPVYPLAGLQLGTSPSSPATLPGAANIGGGIAIG